MSTLAKALAAPTKKTGTFAGKSNALGYGGRAAQLKAQGVPGAVIGAIARRTRRLARPLRHPETRHRPLAATEAAEAAPGAVAARRLREHSSGGRDRPPEAEPPAKR